MASLENNKRRILIISSVDPYKGPGILASDLHDNLVEHGYDCDILTKESVEGHPEILYIHKKNVLNVLLHKIIAKIRYVLCAETSNKKPPYYFFYKSEQHPPVNVSKVLNRISKPYDLVYIYFWQGMLSFKTIEALYDKLHCQIHFAGVDYSQMSGGCHFTIDCERYKTGCGKCPVWKSNDANDFTCKNVEYRAYVYKKVRPVVWGTTYMQVFYKQSYLLKDYDRIETSYATVDEEKFKPIEIEPLRTKYSIAANKNFIILFGSQNIDDPRKGFNYLCAALRILGTHLTDEQRDEILIMTIGRAGTITSDLPFAVHSIGYVPYTQLPEIYSVANLFVCPSVYDAGPMMVNQSIMCGTPVVGFEVGALLDLVKGRNTGLCAEYKDSQSLALCINEIYNLFRCHKDRYDEMRHNCRALGLSLLSKRAQLEFLDKAIKRYAAAEPTS